MSAVFVQLKKPFMGKAIGERISVTEDDARQLITLGTADPVTDDLITPAINKAMTNYFDAFTKNLDGIVNATLQKFQQAQSEAQKHARPAIFGPGGDGDTKHCFGDWLCKVAIATLGKGDRSAAIQSLEKEYGSSFNPWQKAALGESSGVTGGYIVPPEFYTDLLSIAAEESTFRQNAMVMPMASATLQFPYLDITTAQSAGNSPFFGGVVANWTAEAQTRTETEPQFKMMELKAQELSGYTISSNILLQDAAFGLERFLKVLFGKAVAWYEEYAFFQGNGVGKPLGILNSTASKSVTRNTASHIKFADIANMLQALLPASYGRAHWWVNPTGVGDLIQLQDGANRAVFISIDQGAVKAPIWKLLGMPVHVTEKLPAEGTNGVLVLADPSLYVIGDRQMLEIAASEHVNFLKNQMTWRFVQRIDGRPWLENTITLQDSTTTVSPFVYLTQ
jgi:HK97 family phage major capsid protein